MPQNGDASVVAEGDMIVSLEPSDEGSSIQGGGEGGAAVFNDVTLTIERENTMHHGIGNNDPIDHTTGNRNYSFSTEVQVSRAVYETIRQMYRDETPGSGTILAEEDGSSTGNASLVAPEANIGVIVWNNIELTASDGDNVTISVDADCYQVDLA